MNKVNSLELFAGAGGLAIAAANSGCHHLAVVENDKWCCETIRNNKQNNHKLIKDWSISEQDVSKYEYSRLTDDVEVVTGGPPCQPFSLGGKGTSRKDKRDMFPEVVRAMRELQPKAVVIENVKGLLRERFSTYLEYVLLQMTYPNVTRKKRETWLRHLSRLESRHTSGKHNGLEYQVVFQSLNAADYGIPQSRERVFFVAFRSDLGVNWSFRGDVRPTHSADRLLWDKWVSGDYWDEHELRPRHTPAELDSKIEKLEAADEPAGLRWVTTRDALYDLPDPRREANNDIPNHVFRSGARRYPGHTGSPWDQPAKTLKAGFHGIPGGENMLRHDNGRVRYFTVREMARLQTFPDDFVICGPWSQQIKQVGNAVPVRLGESVLKSVVKTIC